MPVVAVTLAKRDSDFFVYCIACLSPRPGVSMLVEMKLPLLTFIFAMNSLRRHTRDLGLQDPYLDPMLRRRGLSEASHSVITKGDASKPTTMSGERRAISNEDMG